MGDFEYDLNSKSRVDSLCRKHFKDLFKIKVAQFSIVYCFIASRFQYTINSRRLFYKIIYISLKYNLNHYLY